MATSPRTDPGRPEPWIIDAARRRVADFSSALRACPPGVDGATPVPGFEWTVADLAGHVACLPRFWGTQHDAGDRFDRPDDFAAFSDSVRARITETDPGQLADLIDAEFDDFIALLATWSGPRWLYATETTSTASCGLIISELVLHGIDLARVTGGPRPAFSRDEANAAVDAMMVTTPAFVDESKARAQPDGVYGVHFLAGLDYTWIKRGGTLVIEPGRPAKADARLRADPATFVLSSLGRIGQVRAGLSGKMFAYGRRPWRFLGLATIAVDGV